MLAGVDPVSSLSGKTTSGGRLDASKALDFFDQQAPAAPQLTSTAPASPADANQPRILGIAEEGSTVRLYLGASCGGAPVAVGSAALLGSPGIAVNVTDNSTTQFSAKATDTALNPSPCSNPITYNEVTPPPAAPFAVHVGCTVPKLAGKTLGQAQGGLERRRAARSAR